MNEVHRKGLSADSGANPFGMQAFTPYTLNH